jgi:hypothetical protein
MRRKAERTLDPYLIVALAKEILLLFSSVTFIPEGPCRKWPDKVMIP